ncbi:NAD(P)-binding domain-containing protein [Chitinophagaceae bacterium LB-8]|uniref:Glycerol-3-phosphate dehydrogenase n=1 Tax=Paraflavisolibacter caeni TaxID=2982496 RepID=A0A9X3BGQ1_9BACT|nr:NAD(P)H-dependent glycerol-3-phosphate dehydrogenase [Paraflavisolibacter caeni]MCU7551334.1 NAD(P)-binding domain-containing protein [Paraflavisolibacter caeni]
MNFKFGVIGSGSWATALVKILTDNGHNVNWWVRKTDTIQYIQNRRHNPHYLSSAYFDVSLLTMNDNINEVIATSDVIVLAVPSAYLEEVCAGLDKDLMVNIKVLSAIKGLVPGADILVNEYLQQHFGVSIENYFALLGPCHAEEVASEKLSYLTFSGVDVNTTKQIASCFSTCYINTVINNDILGVQYAAVLKNIYALGAGIAHGLDYGDNFLSVYIANSADEMASFLRTTGIKHIVVGEHHTNPDTHQKDINYAASVYLGDLLVTCYSPYSRNRTFGNMIGKGYTVQSAQLEMNMVAEGYYASRCMHNINKNIKAEIPIAETIYKILWERLVPAEGFSRIEEVMV